MRSSGCKGSVDIASVFGVGCKSEHQLTVESKVLSETSSSHRASTAYIITDVNTSLHTYNGYSVTDGQHCYITYHCISDSI